MYGNRTCDFVQKISYGRRIVMKPAIIIPAYNRPDSLQRLLSFIDAASFIYDDIPLVISVDGGGDIKVVELANSFEWKYGQKEVVIHDQHLGLRNHIISCGDLCYRFGSIILLEDDLIVGPDFYNFAVQAVNEYDKDPSIAGVSLYAYRNNENVSLLPFSPIDNGYDVFFMQVPSSWGQAWTQTQWDRFRNYYSSCSEVTSKDRLPSNVIRWPESSWKKYFFKYIVEKDLYFVYPYVSHTSNWGDVGTHFHYENAVTYFRVQLALSRNMKYRFPSFSKEGVVYDAFFEILPEYLRRQGFAATSDFGVDLYGAKDLSLYRQKMFLSSKYCNKAITQFGIELFPIEHNVLFGVPGSEISFADSTSFVSPPQDFIEKMFTLQHQKAYDCGCVKGELSITQSVSYRLGHFLTSPIRKLKRIKR